MNLKNNLGSSSEKITSLEEFRTFLENELPRSSSLLQWLGGYKNESDLVGLVSALKIELGLYRERSIDAMVGREAIRRFEAGEPDFNPWQDKKEVDFKPLG